MWNILLAAEQEARQLLMSRAVRLQSIMGTRRAKITIHGVLVDSSKDRIGASLFFAKYGQVEHVSAVVSKPGRSGMTHLQSSTTAAELTTTATEKSSDSVWKEVKRGQITTSPPSP